MRWRKLKKYIREHPYLIDKAYKLSMEEAQKRIDEARTPTFEETIHAAMRKSSLPASAWEPALQAIARRKKERARRRALVPITAALAAVVLFFSATPVGQAWATDAARLVARLFNGNLVVENMENSGKIAIPRETEESLPQNPAETNAEAGEIEYSSFAELYEKTGLNPIVMGYEGYTLKSVTLYTDMVDGKMLAVIYQNEALGELVTRQTWSTGEGSATGIKEPYFEKPILNGTQSMYCCINEDETPEFFEGIAVLEREKMIFQIGFTANTSTDAILGSLQYYK